MRMNVSGGAGALVVFCCFDARWTVEAAIERAAGRSSQAAIAVAFFGAAAFFARAFFGAAGFRPPPPLLLLEHRLVGLHVTVLAACLVVIVRLCALCCRGCDMLQYRRW